MLTKNIALIGFMGSGKSTVGRLLAESLGAEFTDGDTEIERVAEMTVSEIFEKCGEPHFRKLETETIKRLSAIPNQIFSPGGGAVLNPENVKVLKEHCVVVYLNVSAEEVAERLADDDTRPLLAGGDKLTKIKERLTARLPIYMAAADIAVVCDGCTPEENCGKVIEMLKKLQKLRKILKNLRKKKKS